MKSGMIAILVLVLLSSCSKQQDYSVASPISVSGNVIQVRSDSKLTEQIHVVAVGVAPGGERKLRMVGQMIAMANSSGELVDKKVSWVMLDPELVHSLGLHLPDTGPVGYAFGATSVGSNYRDQIHAGEKVEVYRYGLRQNSSAGTVVSVRKVNEDEDSILFGISHGQDWYPGTNCEVEFPLIHHAAVAISPLSMLHEGLREYVLKEVSPGHFEPVEITVVNETSERVFALGNLVAGERIVERGAILLKPLVHQILSEAGHVQ